MSRLYVRVFLCVFFLTPILTCTTVFAEAKLESLTICKGVSGDELTPVDPTDTFAPDTAIIHAVAKIKNEKSGTRVGVILIAVDAIPAPNYEISNLQQEVEKKGTVNVHFELEKPGPAWHAGNYKVDVYIDELKVGSTPFSVK